MSKPNLPPLQMSSLIAADAPLLSPGSEWADRHPQDTSHYYSQYAQFHQQLPPSPPVSVAGSVLNDSPRILKTRMSPESAQMCLPTHQLFDLGDVPNSSYNQAPPSPALSEVNHFHRVSVAIKPPTISVALKRSASPALVPPPAKKRSVSERISTKDFVPPDVSGLSKREARLVKNRAAAFLSRQRKREEFETMEGRVLELEQDNARLLAQLQSQSGNSHSLPSTSHDAELRSEVESLKAQLSASRERERQLAAQISLQSSPSTPQEPSVKVEGSDDGYSALSSSPRQQHPKGASSAASLGLMVLLCALPSLLSMNTQDSSPTHFSLPSSPVASMGSSDFNSYLPADRPLGWSMESNKATKPHKLQFTGDSKLLNDLNSLDVSFDTIPSADGKIRVRIHPSSTASSRSTSPGSTLYSGSPNHPATSSSSLGLELWGKADADCSSFDPSFPSSTTSSFPSYSSPNPDAFLGVGGFAHNDFASSPTSFSSPSSHNFHGHSDYTHSQLSSPTNSSSSTLFGGVGDLDTYSTEFGFGSAPLDYQNKRRIRIALKSMPETPAQGGEWELQVC